MLELPEAAVMAQQMKTAVLGKTIKTVVVGYSSHKFAFFSAEPEAYVALLQGRQVQEAEALGGLIELRLNGGAGLRLGDGAQPRYFAAGQPLPQKHQLLLGFEDKSALCCSVQMYGGMWAFEEGEPESPYALAARERPSPLAESFDEDWFERLVKEAKPTLSAKAFLATEQRIPGFGNGVLQDILWRAGVHPKTKLQQLSRQDLQNVFLHIKGDLAKMTAKGGRDTEKDLFGAPGGYRVLLCAKTAGTPCPVCGTAIQKQAYLGGSVYFCPVCQPLA